LDHKKIKVETVSVVFEPSGERVSDVFIILD
jgi:hypothetical protein